jgi:hypothetical protein
MKSTTAFKSEIKHTQNFAHKDFWSKNQVPGKTHKGKTSERGEAFIIKSSRRIFLAVVIFTKLNTQNYLVLCAHTQRRKLCHQLLNFFVLKSVHNTTVTTLNGVQLASKFMQAC